MTEQIGNDKSFVTAPTREPSGDTTPLRENHLNLAQTMLNQKTPWHTDKWIYRIVVSAMSLTIISALGGAIWLEAKEKDVPEILIALGTGALGGVAGLLAPTPNYSDHE